MRKTYLKVVETDTQPKTNYAFYLTLRHFKNQFENFCYQMSVHEITTNLRLTASIRRIQDIVRESTVKDKLPLELQVFFQTISDEEKKRDGHFKLKQNSLIICLKRLIQLENISNPDIYSPAQSKASSSGLSD